MIFLSKVSTFLNVKSSVTRLGDFWKFLLRNFLTKVYLLNVKHCCVYFLGNFWKKCVPFYCNIRSHWQQQEENSFPINKRLYKTFKNWKKKQILQNVWTLPAYLPTKAYFSEKSILISPVRRLSEKRLTIFYQFKFESDNWKKLNFNR